MSELDGQRGRLVTGTESFLTVSDLCLLKNNFVLHQTITEYISMQCSPMFLKNHLQQFVAGMLKITICHITTTN